MAVEEPGRADAGASVRERDRPPASAVAAVSIPEARGLLALATAVIVIAALYVAQEVLIPITLAVILSFVLSPLVNLLGRAGLWRMPAVVASIVVALGAIGLLGVVIGSQASTLATDLPRYAETIGEKIQGTEAFATRHVAELTKLIPGLGRPPAEQAPVRPAGRSRAAANTPMVVEMAKPEASALALASAILTPVVRPLETAVIVIVVAIFILIQKEDLRDRFIRLVGSSDLNRTTAAIDDAAQRLSRYFLSQLAVNTTFGIVIGLGLWALGIPSPAVWGLLSAMLRFVPYLGPILAAIPPLALAAAVDPGWSKAVYVGILFVVVEPLTGYVVEPLLYGHSTGLAPISVIVAAIFWTWLWGPIGLILSTPLTLCLVVVGRHARPLEFFDVLLGDRPALPAVDRFYQRLLASDPDEVLAQAETFLTGRPLVEYYDTVALPALARAAYDEEQGAISREQAAGMLESLHEIVSELGRTAPAPPPPRTDRGRVACVSGRGHFDDVVSRMLAQLLEREGLRARPVPCRLASRDAIGALDVTEVSVFALSYVDLATPPAHLRYLIARLRQRAPGASIVAGLWPAGHGVLNDAASRATIGADRYVTSLREAVESARVLAAGR
jgi:predicted PurR-regulated permease PerM